jgi:hypothetical protein
MPEGTRPSFVERALSTEWKRWWRRFPAHLQQILPGTQPGGRVSRALVHAALRSRRTWIANGTPAQPLSTDTRQLEKEWWGALLFTGGAARADKPEAPSADRALRDGVTEMREAAPDYPKPKWVGAIPAELVDGWLQLRQGGGCNVGGKWMSSISWPRQSGRHAEKRHLLTYPDLSALFRAIAAERRINPKAGELARVWNEESDRQANALIAAWYAGQLQRAVSKSERRIAIYAALDRLRAIGLPYEEIVHWLGSRVTAAQRPAGGRLTLKMAADLLVHPHRLVQQLSDRALLQLVTTGVRSIGREPHQERCRQAVVSLAPPIFGTDSILLSGTRLEIKPSDRSAGRDPSGLAK